jgi:ribosomal protein L16/L10AE
MGRGKGMVAVKVAILYKGQILLEIKNLNNILMFYISHTVKMKFPFLKMTYIK